jgi:hypothetical protein
MRPKDRNIIKKKKPFKKMPENKNLLLAALRYYTSAFFAMICQAPNSTFPSGAC